MSLLLDGLRSRGEYPLALLLADQQPEECLGMLLGFVRSAVTSNVVILEDKAVFYLNLLDDAAWDMTAPADGASLIPKSEIEKRHRAANVIVARELANLWGCQGLEDVGRGLLKVRALFFDRVARGWKQSGDPRDTVYFLCFLLQRYRSSRWNEVKELILTALRDSSGRDCSVAKIDETLRWLACSCNLKEDSGAREFFRILSVARGRNISLEQLAGELKVLKKHRESQ